MSDLLWSAVSPSRSLILSHLSLSNTSLFLRLFDFFLFFLQLGCLPSFLFYTLALSRNDYTPYEVSTVCQHPYSSSAISHTKKKTHTHIICRNFNGHGCLSITAVGKTQHHSCPPRALANSLIFFFVPAWTENPMWPRWTGALILAV